MIPYNITVTLYNNIIASIYNSSAELHRPLQCNVPNGKLGNWILLKLKGIEKLF